ncbi:TetR/AcrR family transcriptional regulator [Pseudomaricurvus sp. HS19]|uniref:TetR/AcrR family transcriptional regulator n=1 Tax=Pseudomaricurvus sp. HS19 TaxID=2692626 RepID=UPI001370A0C6|nr:TetR/AcrR family transcriptional regulator [Pseudomaricurvus sp. HS19]MYM61918.1 TetR family transcriptional regulator [Pseudomaricurvus sp. HS19]
MSSRRLGAKSSETRSQLIDAADQILKQEGSAALTARKVADKIGLSRHIVNYYFGSMEELIVAILQRDRSNFRELYRAALESDDPLRIITQRGIDISAKNFDLIALAFRYDAVRSELTQAIEEFRTLQTEILTRHLDARGIQPSVAPMVTASILQILSQTISAEAAIGVTCGHDQIRSYIDSWLEMFATKGLSPVIDSDSTRPA